MLVEAACFDPNNNCTTAAATIDQVQGVVVEDSFSQSQVPTFSMSLDHHSYHQNQQVAAAAAMEMELQQQLTIEGEVVYNNQISSGWEDMSFGTYNNNNSQQQQHQQHHHHHHLDHMHQNFSMDTTDLLHMLPLPRCSSSSLLPSPSFSFTNSGHHHHKSSANFLTSLGLLGDLSGADGGMAASSVGYDPLLPVNLPPQPPMLRELMHGYNLGGSRSGSLFSTGVDEFQDGIGENGVFEFTPDMKCIGKSRDGIGKDSKHFVTERQRRVQLNDKFQALRNLVPSPTKNDRASVVGDAIEYINELKRSVADLKILVEKKRCTKERLKRQKLSEEGGVKTEDDVDHPYSGSALRSSWLHRKSKTTEVDVRIVDDEVTVKLVQQKRLNCLLLLVSKVLDELQLDLHHVAGGLVGDYYSFLFNSKIGEGSTVYAHAIANKLIEVVDKQYASVQPTSSY